jgi:hypothetical protein
MEVSSQLHAPAALSISKDTRYALYRRLGGAQSQSGEEKNNPSPYRESNPGLPTCSLASVLTEQPRPGRLTGLPAYQVAA